MKIDVYAVGEFELVTNGSQINSVWRRFWNQCTELSRKRKLPENTEII